MTGSHLCIRSLMSTSPPPLHLLPYSPAPFAKLFDFTIALHLCLFHFRSLQTPCSTPQLHSHPLQPPGLRHGQHTASLQHLPQEAKL